LETGQRLGFQAFARKNMPSRHCPLLAQFGHSPAAPTCVTTTVVRSVACPLVSVALSCLGACATQPPDRLAYPTEQTELRYPDRPPISGPFGRYPFVDVQSIIVDEHPQVTAICRDSWVSYSQNRSETCAGHRGVKEWRHRPGENVVGRVVSSRAVSIFVGDVEVLATLFELQSTGLHQRAVRFLELQDNCALGEPSERLFRVTLERQQIRYAQHANEAPYEPTDLVATACGPVPE